MITNPKLKFYLLISQNIGKRLSDILLVENLKIPNYRITYDNISIVQIAKNRLQMFETETGTSILYYSRGSFYCRNSYYQWVNFDIDSVLNDEIEDIV